MAWWLKGNEAESSFGYGESLVACHEFGGLPGDFGSHMVFDEDASCVLIEGTNVTVAQRHLCLSLPLLLKQNTYFSGNEEDEGR